MKSIITRTVIAAAMMTSYSAQAAYKIDIDKKSSISFGGYIKVDSRLVSGDVAYKDFWTGNAKIEDTDKNQFKIFANETRFNTKYINGDVTGFIEMDFLGGGGNQIVSNSSHPRIRHAFIAYKGFTVGQTWTTFMNTSAIPETADFAGATVGLAFIRQGLLRYSKNGFQIALENPETWGGDTSQESLPDLIARYNIKGDWGNISLSALGRELVSVSGIKNHAYGGSIAGKINTWGKDDFKFQYHYGELGRYIGAGATKDMIGEEVEEVTSLLVAYRHFWTDTLRSNVIFGQIETDITDIKRSQWGVNLFSDITKSLSVGFEVGQFIIDQENKDDANSVYAQFSMRFAI
ncbi:DcaP family trimeric outer membrane transporter [Parashewanella tropica]|uniref:DcaP family trimeric outer membrane transporter n=1 Tax=Parashewanella tropica TaxID=2547970 RepID=UPI00105933CD|nr:DcaP family trimeric outer membrane transporter [Parashewanella tropica]